jgi:hypothetical protein
MSYRPLVHYASEDEYREHFMRVYCRDPITTFDGIDVRLYPEHFDHAFYEGTFKSGFSRERAERIDWIAAALTDAGARLYVGWDADKRRERPNHRVCVAGAHYVVVIHRIAPKKAKFVTAFVGSAHTLRQITSGRKWPK